MSWTIEDIPDQSGRTALITGGNAGLGLETARALAGKGARVVIAARDQARAEEAEADIRRDSPDAHLRIEKLDLASLESVRRLADRLRSGFDRVDILVNNAGVMATSEARTADGFELQLGVNHLGHYALTALVLPLLVRSPGSRVVGVTSTGRHLGCSLDPSNPHLEGRYAPWRAYGNSKLANLHFAIGLETRLRAAGAETESLIAHPGLTYTDLQRRSVRESEGGAGQRLSEFFARSTGMSPARGALSLLRAATDPKGRGGELYAPRFVNNGPPVRRPLMGRSLDREAIDTLWEVSRRETGIELDVSAAVGESAG